MRRAALVAALSLPLAGCGGEEPAPQVGLRAASGAPAPAAGRTLEEFVDAAARGDAAAMWALLSEPTRASLGPTLGRFRAGTAAELHEDVGVLGGVSELVLARAFGRRWAVAAVAGERVVEDETEQLAYAAALRREEGGWRLELGGLVFASLRPAPLTRIDEPRPLLSATAQSSTRIERIVLWLDGDPVGTRAQRAPFTGTVVARPPEALPPGIHVVTAFAATEETAGALAWPFERAD